jgi:predicted PurR-regulated permease PerM
MQTSRGIERILLLGVIALLGLGSFLVLLPFLSGLLWASILCFATWPVFERLVAWLRGRRTVAATFMCLGVTVLLVAPFVIVGASLADNVGNLVQLLHSVLAQGPSAPPDWLASLPLVGNRLAQLWVSATTDVGSLLDQMRGSLPAISKWMLAHGLALGHGVLQLALSVFVAFFIYRDGDVLADRVASAVTRVAGARGESLLKLAGGTVKGVVYGIIGTALAQGILAGIGFVIAGVPGALLLGLMTFFLSVVPMGPPLIWIPASVWLYYQGHPGMAIFVALWGMLVVSSVDNFLKPYLISQGAAMPFILVLFGVLGGLAAFGFLGVFLGPTLLAVAFSIVRDWTLRPATSATPNA